ncbi:unnamed protein product [Phytophthora fragariaefolia]|uniref:Unnamed protein product n=1 Tax=Phytophthora fragariaefolia TaxID=1490495 RepID=A0A9W7DA95_9STRA|nr:unnamed protein product [Phytophthora fragariaefolia]
MTTRNTARRVLRSHTAPDRRLLELENGDREESATGATNRSQTGSAQRLEQLETGLADLRQELTAIWRPRSSFDKHVDHPKSDTSCCRKGSADCCRSSKPNTFPAKYPAVRLTPLNPSTAQNQEQRQSYREHLAEAAAMNNVAMTEHEKPDSPMPIQNQAVMPRLRKMDVSPPHFEGLIDEIKLNSFIFRFESYVLQKGYFLTTHDHLLPLELNQCVRKNALIWYERYMTDSMTSKLWSVMKGEMIREFREPNFHAKLRNQVLKLKQIGAYHGYVNKFREQQRTVGLDELTAINVFVNGLTSVQVKQAIQRKQPTTLTGAVQDGFLEWELLGNTLQRHQASNRTGNAFNSTGGLNKNPVNGKQKRHINKADSRVNPPGKGDSIARANSGATCSHCDRGVHKVEDCWVLHPEKKPQSLKRKQQLHSKIYALLETLDFGDEQQHPSTVNGASN